jgi:hypothetical protein
VSQSSSGIPELGDFFSTSGTGADLEFRTGEGGSFTTVATTSGGGMVAGQWYHVCAEKDGTGKIRIYIDGVMKGSATPADSTSRNSSALFTIGGDAFNRVLNGWLDEVRITKGVARYASDSGFTVPTAAFPRS